MTIRPNSLRNALLDGGLLALAMTLAALMTNLAGSAEPVVDLQPDPRATDDAIDSRQNTDDNLPSGSPAESVTDKAQTNILGMTLRQDGEGRVIVADVGATSPAWDAGIRQGDQILELHDLKPLNFAKWSRDIASVLGKTQDGQAVPVEILRHDKRVSLRVKLPESRSAEVRDARQEERMRAELGRSQQRQEEHDPGEPSAGYGGTSPQPYPYSPGWGGGVDVIAENGTSGIQGEGDGQAATNAVAELLRIGTLDRRNESQQAGAGQRAGMATFQNTDQGVAAHVEVYGLPRGNYVVGISDATGMAGFVNPLDGSVGADDFSGEVGNNAPRQPLPRDGRPDFPQQRSDQAPDPRGQPTAPSQPRPTPHPRDGLPGSPSFQPPTPDAPQAVPGSSGTPAPGNPQPGQSSLPTSPSIGYLAQQFDAPAEAYREADVPTSDPRSPRRDGPGVPQRRQGGPTQGAASRRPGQSEGFRPPTDGLAHGGSPAFLMQIGVIQVGVSGAGQVQNRLEGVRVQNLTGLSVVVAQANSRTGDGLPGSARQPIDQDQADPRQPRRPQPTNGTAGANADPQSAAPGVVAVGPIRLVEGNGLPPQSSNEPVERARSEGQRLDAERREEAQRRQYSPTPPEEQFDGTN